MKPPEKSLAWLNPRDLSDDVSQYQLFGLPHSIHLLHRSTEPMRSANHSLATRRTFLQASAAVSTLAFGGWARNDAPPPAKLDWHNVEDWGLEGKGFDDTALYYDRLPARAEQKVRTPVWNLSRHSAGMVTRFNTDATSISVIANAERISPSSNGCSHSFLCSSVP